MSTNPLEALLLTGLAQNRFPPNSRYHGIATAITMRADGRVVAYLRRRFAPQPADLALLRTHTVTPGERLDNITAQTLGDPQLFWRICDANAALRPDELTEPALPSDGGGEVARGWRTLRIALPEGVPGTPNG
jgi:hypothetical protein